MDANAPVRTRHVESSRSSKELAARGCNPLQRVRPHLAVDEGAGRSDPLPDVVGQLERVRRIEERDRRRALLQKTRFPVPRLRRIRTGRILQPECRLVVRDTPCNRDGRRGLTGRRSTSIPRPPCSAPSRPPSVRSIRVHAAMAFTDSADVVFSVEASAADGRVRPRDWLWGHGLLRFRPGRRSRGLRGHH